MTWSGNIIFTMTDDMFFTVAGLVCDLSFNSGKEHHILVTKIHIKGFGSKGLRGLLPPPLFICNHCHHCWWKVVKFRLTDFEPEGIFFTCKICRDSVSMLSHSKDYTI